MTSPNLNMSVLLVGVISGIRITEFRPKRPWVPGERMPEDTVDAEAAYLGFVSLCARVNESEAVEHTYEAVRAKPKRAAGTMTWRDRDSI